MTKTTGQLIEEKQASLNGLLKERLTLRSELSSLPDAEFAVEAELVDDISDISENIRIQQEELGLLIREHAVEHEFDGYTLKPEATGSSVAFNGSTLTITNDARSSGSVELSKAQAARLIEALQAYCED